MNALILAAGLGTRLGVLTSNCPKALVKVAGRTMLEHQILKFKAAGFDHIAVNVHHFADQITEFLRLNDNFGTDIIVSDERELLLDTGGGIRKAFHLFHDDAPMLVHNVDIFSTTDLGKFYREHIDSGADATLLTASRKTSRYLHFDRDMRLRGWSNENSGEIRSPYPDFRKETCTPLAFQGIHVISRSTLPLLDGISAERFSITDFYVSNADRLNLRAVFEDSGNWVDAGKPEALQTAAGICMQEISKQIHNFA